MDQLITEYEKSGLISDPTRHFQACYICKDRYHLNDLNDVDVEESDGSHNTILACDECKPNDKSDSR